MKNIQIFTDGACSGNPGPGGWGAIIKINGNTVELSGFEADTTNNRMELTAVIEALESVSGAYENSKITVTTDSKYVCDAINQNWLANWQKNGWRKSDKKPVLNQDLWQELLASLGNHDVKFVWVKGHAGHPENERCDELATQAIANHTNKPEFTKTGMGQRMMAQYEIDKSKDYIISDPILDLLANVNTVDISGLNAIDKKAVLDFIQTLKNKN